jgi:hypothetical protein
MQFGSFRENAAVEGMPPPPRSIGIIDLERKSEIISCNQ